MTLTTIDQAHCQECGSTRPQDVGYDAIRETEGYTICCNQRVVGGGRDYMNRPVKCDPRQCSHD